MKITKQRLKEIIKEELAAEGKRTDMSMPALSPEDFEGPGLGDLQSDEKFTGGSREAQMIMRIKARELLQAMSKEELAALAKDLDAATVAELRHLLANPMYAPMDEGEEELEENQDPKELRRRRAMLKQAALEVDKGRLHVGDLKRIRQRIRDGERVSKIVRDYPRNFPAYR
tara:strand:- start:467 stop:982 length:516 start_codon:yes stop_codon:yes gene_type:complete